MRPKAVWCQRWDDVRRGIGLEILVNEEVIEVKAPAVLIEVLKIVNVQPERRGIAVAVNEHVVRRADWGAFAISGGDRIEIIQATQGG